MTILAASLLVAVLFAGGVYLLLHRGVLEVVLGIALLSQGANLLVVTAGGWAPDQSPPILAEKGAKDPETGLTVSTIMPADYTDPLPQALVLTAIVIGFGLLSYLMALAARTAEATGDLEAGEAPPEDGL